MRIEIPLNSATKKNHNQVVTINGRMVIIPSKPYLKYSKECKKYLPKTETPIDYPINLKVAYYMQTKRKVDLTNLLQATCDILVDNHIIADDNRNIVASFDGTRVFHDKENPRAIIEITKLEDYEQW